jgi:site-specific recombinase XerD
MNVMCNTRAMSLTDYSPASHELAHPDHPTEPLVMAWLASFSSPKTREAYAYDLRRFSEWLAHHRAGTLLTATRTHLDLFARGLEKAGYSPATRARWLSSLSSFYAYSCSVGATAENPASRVRRPKLPNYSPRLGLNLDTAPRVIEAAERLTADHRGLVALCLFAGLRVSEALGVEARDIRTEAGHTVLEVTSKGGRRDLVPLSPAALRLLTELLELRPSGSLLAGTDRFRAHRMVGDLGREAGLEGKLTPHDLRHGAATCALEAGEPLHRVQQLLRHASPLTTQRYDHSRDRLDASAAYGLARAIGGKA